MDGKRLDKPESMSQNTYELITQCWCQVPKERLEIGSIKNS